MKSANGNDAIESLSDAAEPRCLPVKELREGGSLVVIPPDLNSVPR
jgi:hypothetical protein